MFRSETFPIVSSRSDVSSPSCSVEFDKISITKCHITFHDVIPQEFSTVPIFKLMKENIHKYLIFRLKRWSFDGITHEKRR